MTDALDAYEQGLQGLGYDVVRTDRGLTATSASFELTARVRHPAGSDGCLAVGLR